MNADSKVAIVTGASRGIGKAIALALGKQGHRVVVNYHSNVEEAEAVVRAVKETGGEAVAHQADVSDYAEAEGLVEKAKETFGRIDILVNNSGIARDQLMLRMKEEDFDKVIAVNLKGAWNMCKHVARPMLKQKSGRIINIASVVGLIGNAGQTNYVASKAGLIGMTKSLAQEFGKKNVTVNALAPGFIRTKMTDSLPEEIKDDYLAKIPLGRFGEPEDVAAAVLFLAGDAAAYISGQILGVNGGMYG